jgi:hypothetical protein
VPGDHADLLQDTNMMSEQVRRHRQKPLQLGRGRLAEQERIDDRQPPRITQGRVHGSPPHQLAISLRSH